MKLGDWQRLNAEYAGLDQVLVASPGAQPAAPAMPAAAPRARRLAAEDWEDAALAALATGGVEAVAIELLAKQLGVSRARPPARGLPPEAARHRALLAYATYVGLLHLGREAPGE